MESKDKKMNMVTKIKLARIKASLSQEAVAAALNIGQSMYAKLEAGRSEITVSKLIKIMDLLEMKFSDFDDPADLPSTNQEIEIRKLRADLDRISSKILSFDFDKMIPKKKLKSEAS